MQFEKILKKSITHSKKRYKEKKQHKCFCTYWICFCAGEMSKYMLTFSLEHHVTHDFSQHGNTRAVSQDMENKVTGVAYLKK